MIRLITATPGSGKTCLVVEWLLREIDKGFYKSFYCNIADLKICGVRQLLSDWRDVPEDKKPALIIVDEAQYHDEFMKETTKNNEIGKALSTHRHYGVDMWLITQSPKLLNSYVIENVGEHVHLYRPRKKKTVTVYWWSYAVISLVKSNFKQADDIQKWALNPHMFDYYKSTVSVTDSQARISQKTLTSYISVVLIFIVIGVFVNKGIQAMKGDNTVKVDVTSDKIIDVSSAAPVAKDQELKNTNIEQTENTRISAIFNTPSGCRAYSGSGDLLQLDQDQCKDLASNFYKLKAASDDVVNERLKAVNYQIQQQTVLTQSLN